MDSIFAALALVLVAYKISEPKRVVKTPNIPFINGEIRQPAKTELSLSIKVLLFTSFVAGIGVGFIMPISVLFYNDKFGIEPVEIGLIISITGFIGIFASWLAGRVSDKIGRKPVIALGGLTSRFCGIALPLTFDVNQAAIVMALRSLGFNVFMPAARALRADIVPSASRGKIFGMFMTAFTAGDIIGPIIGTWLYSLYRFEILNIGGILLPGYGIPFFVNAILGLISILLILIFVKERRS